MKTGLLCTTLMIISSLGFAISAPGPVTSNQTQEDKLLVTSIPSLKNLGLLTYADRSLIDIKNMLQTEAPTLSPAVLQKVIATLSCNKGHETENNHILTVIDYSLPSSEKRLWVFDLDKGQLLYHTYVSHGLKSGTLFSRYFSNKYNSRSSSIGAYMTTQSYYGRDGISLRLNGLDRGFNDNAENRAVVMHGGWYVDEAFIKKYGRAGRSWGCPALPQELSTAIINTIKNQSLLIVYYPSDSWFSKSKFLNCSIFAPKKTAAHVHLTLSVPDAEKRDDILYIDYNKNNQHEENEPIVTMEAQQYAATFKRPPPLERMLRRQINQQEYIALTPQEVQGLLSQDAVNQDTAQNIHSLVFVIPVLKMNRGYYITQMSVVNIGQVEHIQASATADNAPFTLDITGKTLSLKTTNQFIRWLGL